MQGTSKSKVAQQPMTSKEYDSHVQDGTIERYLDE